MKNSPKPRLGETAPMVLNAWVAALALLSGSVAAQTTPAALADPTRPPAALVDVSAASGPEAAGAPVLQSILLPKSKKGRAVAVIGGQQVSVGERYGDSRLIRLTEREAVLEGPSGVEHLALTPGIEKKNRVMKKTKTPRDIPTAASASREVKP